MDTEKLNIRPRIKNIDSVVYKNPGEEFQNLTLRPILKLQHDLIVVYVKAYLLKNKIELTGYDDVKKRSVLSNIFKRDTQLKTELKGMIIGQFTAEEYLVYEGMSSDMNKRILAMLKERLQSVSL